MSEGLEAEGRIAEAVRAILAKRDEKDTSPHCDTCMCFGSKERQRLKSLFSRVPDTGCVDYRAGGYCGKPVWNRQADYCIDHRGRA